MKQHPDLRAAVARAVAWARAARRRPTVFDLFGALIEAPDVHLLVHRAGGDADVLASSLGWTTSAWPPPAFARVWAFAVPDSSFGRAIALAARSKAPSDTELTSAD